jgi:cellulose synthase/poly-beta-1,6-N-acetylglucosamine synthase-like glycosyltransferase
MIIYIVLLFAFVVAIAYSLLILYYRKWFSKLEEFVAENNNPQQKFSIIIPARNEEANIGKCLLAILDQNYSRDFFEVIIVDDHSTDNTSKIVELFANKYNNISLLKLNDILDGKALNSYKKKAIEIAIEKASGNWIITTDADCVFGKNWLSTYNSFIVQNNCVFVAAPVMFTMGATTLSKFQYIDFMVLQATTAAAVKAGFHAMCNGANLAYKKEVFYEVNGFKGIDNIASGDDMLLMNKIKTKHPNKIGYLFSKEAMVTTTPMPTWTSFYNQRIRWASKADKYNDKTLLPVLMLVYVFNLQILLLLLCSFVSIKFLLASIICLLLKTFVESLYINTIGKFFGSISLIKFATLQPLHILYMIVAGWLGKFGKYSWKGRVVK